MLKVEKIFGHKEQKVILNKKFNSEFSDTWMLFGERGLGKFNFIKNFVIEDLAKKIFCTKKDIFNLTTNELKTLNKKLVSSYFHLNEGEKVSIDQLRKLFNQLQLTNSSDKIPKYIIIDNFDTININSKNALLKTLEEPPRMVFIFLVCHNIYNVPKTVTSRCKKIEFRPLSNKDFEDFLKYNTFDNENIKKQNIDDYVNNKPGLLKLLQEYDFEKNISLIEKIANNREVNYLHIQKLIDNFSNNLDLLILLIKYFLYQKAKKTFLQRLNDNKDIQPILSFFDYIKPRLNQNLNISENQYILSIFANYFNNLKQSNE